MGNGVCDWQGASHLRIVAAAPHRAVRRRSVLRAPSDPLGGGVCIGRCHCRARQRGAAAHADASRRNAVTHGVPTAPLARISAILRTLAAADGTLQHVATPVESRTLADT